jgi:DtxR family Mn-dependent transcriptional regulator
MIDRMAQVLGEPAEDPHGAPIPTSGSEFREQHFPSLYEIGEGRPAILRRVSDEDPAALRYLAEMNLVPGVELEVISQAPFNGPLTVRIGTERQIIGRELSESLKVEPLNQE